jgi:hypothetical protein
MNADKTDKKGFFSVPLSLVVNPRLKPRLLRFLDFSSWSLCAHLHSPALAAGASVPQVQVLWLSFFPSWFNLSYWMVDNLTRF